jgi:hypothetical protein
MGNIASRAGWDLFLFGLPLIALLVFGFFRLDQVFTAKKKDLSTPRRENPASDRSGKSMHSDPDGRPWDDQ